ncbi:MAG TPA: hypothetical protein VGF67_01545 [Ktedonobacteraceae bacterium]
MWESGQDVSSRFGPQQTGGTIIEYVRPVDRQASMAQPGQEHPYSAEATLWHGIATEYMVRTRLLWHNGWFRDYDAVAGAWSSKRNAMHLAPLFCAAAGAELIGQLRPTLAEPPRQSNQWAPLSWPAVVITLIGATAGIAPEAAEAVYRFEPLPWGAYLLSLECQVQQADRYRVRFHSQPRAQGADPAEPQKQQCTWEDAWGISAIWRSL